MVMDLQMLGKNLIHICLKERLMLKSGSAEAEFSAAVIKRIMNEVNIHPTAIVSKS